MTPEGKLLPTARKELTLMVVGSIVALLVMGLIVGVVARILVPGREPGGLIVTAIIGALLDRLWIHHRKK